MENNYNEFFFFNEKVDVYNPRKNIVNEGIIVSIRGHFLSILVEGKESIFNSTDNLVFKQWGRGRKIVQFNRVDIKSERNKVYYEGYVREVIKDGIYVLYKMLSQEITEFVSFDIFDKKIVEVGKFSSLVNPNIHQSYEISDIMYKNKPIFKPDKETSNLIKNELESKFNIIEVAGDGNCLYRALAHQIYGNENIYNIIKDAIFDYLEIEEDYFSNFLSINMKEYINLKRCDGVWGDDIEIQACSEIYSKSILIFVNSGKPLKTFHEEENSYERNNITKSSSGSLYLSYHGYKHYNSLLHHNWSTFKAGLLTTIPGDYEKDYLCKVKTHKKNVNAKNLVEDTIDHMLINKKYEEDELLKEENKFVDNEIEEYEPAIINQVLKDSQNDNNYNNNIFENSINFIIESGFTQEEAIMAYSVVGSDPDLMLQYLYSQYYK